MAGVETTRLDRRVNPLDIIRHNVGELSGFDTLAFELIQNADDAEDSSRLRFDVRKEALWVEDDGGFTDCGDQTLDESKCLRRAKSGHRCDFHSFRALSAADKREREDTTGAFGIGFTAVYQVTDHPEIISGKRHWVVDESRTEGQIDQRSADPPIEGTRIVLPWARDSKTKIRQELGMPGVPKNVTSTLLKELKRVVPAALVFARSLECIEIARDGETVMEAERSETGDRLAVECDGVRQEWRVLEGAFVEEAEELRAEHTNSIESARASDVHVALPIGGNSEGGLCVTLPTKERFPLPWLVNADFYPGADRRHLAMNAAHQIQWNTAAMKCAAELIAAELDHLPEVLGADRLWHALAEAKRLADADSKGPMDDALALFWQHLEDVLPWAEVVPTSRGSWVTVGEARFLRSSEEAMALPVLEALDLEIVDPAIRQHQNILLAAGVPLLGLDDIAKGLRASGMEGRLEIDELPTALQESKARTLLWDEMALLFDRLSQADTETTQEELGDVAFLPEVGGALTSPDELWHADDATVSLFREVNGEIPFVDVEQLAAARSLARLCDSLGVSQALSQLGDSLPELLPKAVGQHLVAWFAARESELDPESADQLCELPIFPSAEGCRARAELVLPGDFEDPLGLAVLVDAETTKEHGAFLERIDFPKLSFQVYALERLPEAFGHPETTEEQRVAAVSLLAERLGQVEDLPEARDILASIALVECRDGSWRVPSEVYFDTPEVQDVLGDEPHRARGSEEHPEAVRVLLTWLGVAGEPRAADVLARLETLSSQAINARRVEAAQAAFDWLSGRWLGFSDEERAGFEELRDVSWLVDDGATHWRASDEVYTTFQRYLFSSQGAFLGFSRQQSGAPLLEWLGVKTSPSSQQVVDHLLLCGADDAEINDEVYTYLNTNAEDPELDALLGEPCLRAESAWLRPTDIFFGDHPFGRWRYRLTGRILERRRLLERLAVREAPVYDDALRVMQEIAASAVDRPLDGADQAVLLTCWRMCQTAQITGDLETSVLAELGSVAVVADRGGVPRPPDAVFFEDLIGLATELPGMEDQVISPPLGAAEAMRAAGVRDLSSVAEARIVEMGRRAPGAELAERVVERQPLVQRIVAHESDAPWAEIEARFATVDWASVPELQVSWRMNMPEGGEAVGDARPAHALWDRPSDTLYVMENGAGPVWEGVSIELLRAVLPGAPPGMALGVARALGASTYEEGAAALDAARIPRLADEIDAEVTAGKMSDLDAAQADGVDGVGSGADGSTGSDGTDGPSPEEESDPSPDSEQEEPLPEEEENGDLSNPKGGDHTDSGAEGGRRPSGSPTSGSKKPDGKPQPRQARLRSYVVAPDDHAAPTSDDSDGEADQRRREEIDRAGVDAVLAMEAEAGRSPEEQAHNNPGYDVLSSSASGDVARVIEVKSCGGSWGPAGVSVSPAQLALARTRRDQFWLYVVENALDPDRRVIWMIQDPYARATNFMFDDGWRGVAEPYGDEEYLSIRGGAAA